MIGAVQILPYVLVAALAGSGYHFFTVWQKDQEIARLTLAQTSLTQEVEALRTGMNTQRSTIQALQEANQEQSEQARKLAQEKNAITQDRDSYVGIFRRHDLTKLATAKPGLIEPRINDGTREVLENLERITGNTR